MDSALPATLFYPYFRQINAKGHALDSALDSTGTPFL